MTPAHDPNDFEIGRRHSLPSLIVLDERGNITANGPFLGLDRFEARPAVVAALREQGGSSPESGPTFTPSATALAATPSSSRAVAAVVRQGRAAGQGSRRSRPGRPGHHQPRRAWSHASSAGSTRCTTGDHAAAVVGAPHSGHGTDGGASSSARSNENRPTGDGWTQDPDVLDTWFSSALWPSPRSAGRMRRRSSRSSIRTAFSSPATTSCSSGSSE